MCLICELNPLARSDFDGLCVSCRASIADGLYRVHNVERFSDRELHPDRLRAHYELLDRMAHRTFATIVEFARVYEHPLGCEYPNWIDPKEIHPERLAAAWRDDDRAAAVLAHLEATGRVDYQNSRLVPPVPQPVARAEVG